MNSRLVNNCLFRYLLVGKQYSRARNLIRQWSFVIRFITKCYNKTGVKPINEQALIVRLKINT